MANPTWTDGTANWTAAADWSTGTVPGPADNVTIPAGPSNGATPDPQVTSNVGAVASVSNSSELDIKNGGALATSGNLTNNGEVNLDVGGNATGGSSLTVQGTLTNNEQLAIGNQSETAADTVTVNGLVNNNFAASIFLTGGDIGGASGTATLAINAAAGLGTQGVLTGQVSVGPNAILQFQSGAITSVAQGAYLSLAGPNAFVADAGATTSDSALALTSNAGNLSLSSGASLSTPGALPNGGSISIGAGTVTPTTLTINSAPGLGAAGVINGAVSLQGDGTLAFTQAGRLTGVGVNSSLLINGANTAITAAGSSTGVLALTNLAGEFGVYATTYNAGGAAVTITSTGGLTAGQGSSVSLGTLTSGGGIDVEGGTLTTTGTLTSSGLLRVGTQTATPTLPTPPAAGTSVLNVGTLALTGGLATLGSSANVMTGNVLLSGNATLDLAGPASSLTSPITFAGGASASLQFDLAAFPATGGTFNNTVAGFAAGDTLDLRGLTFNNATTATLKGNSLTVTNGSATDTLTLSNPGGTSFATSADSDGATDVTVVCFVTGTLIRTTRGDRAVEGLVVGDTVVTASGATRPVRWIGHRAIACGAQAVPSDFWPVRIRAGAFGVGACGAALPERHLFLSPGHPVLVGHGGDEVLVPVMCLINGTSVARVPRDHVTYWHVELDAHDILLAEGLPAESFLDLGNRSWFGEDAAANGLANPDSVARGIAGRCRPVAIEGAAVVAEQRRLDAIFAMHLALAARWPTGDDALAGI